MLALVFDTETTGLAKHPHSKMAVQPKIIEFGGALVNVHSGIVVDTLQLIIDPQEPIEPIITKITGLTDEDLKGQPTFTEVAGDIRKFFDAADVLIAHNLPFDSTLLELELQRHEIEDWPWPAIRICMVQEHAEEWGRRPKLLELYEEATGEPLHQTHRALDDVMALIKVCELQGVFDDIAATQSAN